MGVFEKMATLFFGPNLKARMSIFTGDRAMIITLLNTEADEVRPTKQTLAERTYTHT
jgi:hypothetical protein